MQEVSAVGYFCNCCCFRDGWPLLLRQMHDMNLRKLLVPVRPDILEDQTKLPVISRRKRRGSNRLGVHVRLMRTNQRERQRLNLRGRFSSFANSTCTVAPVTTRLPLFATCPSIKVDFPPESDVDSLIWIWPMLTAAASGSSGRIVFAAAAGLCRVPNRMPPTTSRSTRPAAAQTRTGVDVFSGRRGVKRGSNGGCPGLGDAGVGSLLIAPDSILCDFGARSRRREPGSPERINAMSRTGLTQFRIGTGIGRVNNSPNQFVAAEPERWRIGVSA